MRMHYNPNMAKRLTFALALASVTALAYAQPAAEVPWMTGARLVKKLGNVDPRSLHWTPESAFASRAIAAEFHDIMNGEFVQGYTTALRDATEGRQWCWAPAQPKPDTLIVDVTRHLQKMSDEELKRNASDLIVEYWRAKYPCLARGK